MNTYKKYFKKLNLLWKTVLLLLIATVLVYLLRGWIRGTLIPSVYSSYHKPRLETALNTEYEKIKPAFETLGFKDFQHKDKAVCFAEYEKLRLFMPCSSSRWTSNVTLSTDEVNTIKDRITKAKDVFNKNNWSMKPSDHFWSTVSASPGRFYIGQYTKNTNAGLCSILLYSEQDGDSPMLRFNMTCGYGKSRTLTKLEPLLNSNKQ